MHIDGNAAAAALQSADSIGLIKLKTVRIQSICLG